MNPDLATDEGIARSLPLTWSYFFAPFGRLTSAQRAAVPLILKGQDLLLSAATASGKTEAACAPLVERNLRSSHPWTVLYVSPTRALVNDLYQRLYQPLDRLSLRLDRRTGEYRPGGRHSDVLLTTPESFDSMLCRGKWTDPEGHVLSSVVALVLDEIHLLHGTARGEQLRWLIERLRRLLRQAKHAGWSPRDQLQIVALSATVPRPNAVAEAYLQDAEVVTVPGGRQIEVVPAHSACADVETALPAYLATLHHPEKVLVFANARKRVDELAAALRPQLAAIGYTVSAHHGSLHQSEREGTENAVKQERAIVVFTTATLEIGIDIGDIDLVVLDGPAPDVPSLLQRIGRGNRRSGRTRMMACAKGPLDSLIHSAMIKAAREGWLGLGHYGPHHAVARQQIASFIFQAPKRARRRDTVQQFLESCAAQVVARSLLPNMLATSELLEDASGIRLGEVWLEQSRGAGIHSNIEDAFGSTVVDEQTGHAIAVGVQAQSGRGLRTGGHLLEVKKWTDFKIEVRRVSDAELARGDWRYSSKPLHIGSSQPEAVRRYLGIPNSTWPWIEGDEGVYVFHFGGSRRRAVIDLAASAFGIELPSGSIDGWHLQLPFGKAEKPPWLREAGPAMLDVAIGSRLNELEYLLARPSANKHLPVDVRVDEVRGWLHLSEEIAQIKVATWVPAGDIELQRVLRALTKKELSRRP